MFTSCHKISSIICDIINSVECTGEINSEKKITLEELIRRFSALREIGVIGSEPQVVGELKKGGTIGRGVAYLLDRKPIRLEGARVLIGRNGGTCITVFGYDGETVEETLESNIFIKGIVME